MSDTDMISHGKEVSCISVREVRTKKNYIKIYVFGFIERSETYIYSYRLIIKK